MAEPVLVGLLFADHLVEDKQGKKSVIGTFTNINSIDFPLRVVRLGIYAAVTNLEGRHEFALNLVHDETQQVIVALSGRIEAGNRNDVIEITPLFEMVLFPNPGIYNLVFLIDGHQVGARILTVRQITKI